MQECLIDIDEDIEIWKFTLKGNIIVFQDFSLIKGSIFSPNIIFPVENIRVYKKISCRIEVLQKLNMIVSVQVYVLSKQRIKNTKRTIHLGKKTLLQLVDSKFYNNSKVGLNLDFGDSSQHSFYKFEKTILQSWKKHFLQYILYSKLYKISISLQISE